MRHFVAVGDGGLAADPNASGAEINILGVQRPVEIVKYQATVSPD